MHADDARKLWKILAGYHKRSLVETGFYQWKTIFGDKLQSRKLTNQKGEVYAKSMAFNKITSLGMPKGEWIMNQKNQIQDHTDLKFDLRDNALTTKNFDIFYLYALYNYVKYHFCFFDPIYVYKWFHVLPVYYLFLIFLRSAKGFITLILRYFQ